MKHLVIGLGQIGSAVYQVLSDKYEVDALDINPEPVKDKVDVLHICFPYSETFVKEVKRYQIKYSPQLVIIYSTLPIGTTKKIKHAVHSPVEGKHPRLAMSVRVGLRWIGYNNDEDKKLAQKIWRPITLCESVPDSDWTEFLKMASTSKYGINLVWADYMDSVAKHLKMPYAFVKEWDQGYNALYARLDMKSVRKYVLDPPGGVIGGHCVRENAFLLDDQFPNDMLKMIKATKGTK